MNIIFRLIVLFSFLISAALISAQPNERDRGIEFYKQGKNKEAISILEKAARQPEFKDDAELWNYAGLAYAANDDNKKARKALEKAVKLQPERSAFHSNLAYVYLLLKKIDNSQMEAERALQIDPKNVFAYYVMGIANLWEGKLGEALASTEKIFPIDPSFIRGHMLKSDILIAQLGERVANSGDVSLETDLLKQAVDVLENGLKNASAASDLKFLEEKLEGMRAFYKYYDRNRGGLLNTLATPDPGITPLKILRKPRAAYTNNARAAGAQGKIRIAVLFGANGKIQHILMIKRIGYGLDEEVLNAARQIVFEPQLKDGKPVSIVKIVEYNFAIY